jgi:tetratricopeptide (TPR) repeat protein
MAIHKLQVFLASRFDEFHELRAALKSRINRLKVPAVEAIDLNDNAADSEPPLSRCYEAVDRAELFLLLVGNTYGTNLKGYKESYTHLEYRRARRDGSKTILPFLIGNVHHRNFDQRHYDDRQLGAWVSEIRKSHTPSYQDENLDAEQLASNIFDEVLARLVELFWNVDEGDIEGDRDETPGLPEDSPIKLEQLANSPRISKDKANSEQLLKILAANHAKEALAALNLSLPQVAIHHLRKAAELAPLDIVIGYWLARLLVATGRRKQCLEAQRIALLCARVAGEQDNEHELKAMACRIIAVRASERLGELDLALEYAKTAHDDMRHHWMAKLEYGRQLALAGNKNAALDKAGEAFWLRPDLIRQIQRDVAYRALGKDFEQFRATLRQTVIQETEQITRLESRIREFSQALGVGEAAVYPGAESAEVPRYEQRTVLQTIGAGRVSVKSSFQILQKCAKKLLADSVSFAPDGIDGVRGLTPETKEHIQERIRDVKLEIDNYSEQLSEAKQGAKQASEEITVVMRRSIWGGVLILAIAIAIAVLTDVMVTTAITIAIIVLGGWGVWRMVQSLEADKAKNLASAQDSDLKLEDAGRRLAELTDAMSLFEATESELRRNTKNFCKLIDQFETTGLSRLPFSPAVPIDRKGTQDLGRADASKAEKLGNAFDAELLPLQLRFIAESSTPKSKYWLARRVRSGEIEAWNRSAAYFQ